MENKGDSMAQASQIWSMLDDMAENNPAAYRQFIDKQLKEGRELSSAPTPHMSVFTHVVSGSETVMV